MALLCDFSHQFLIRSISTPNSSLNPKFLVLETLVVPIKSNPNGFATSSTSVNRRSRVLPVVQCCKSSVISVEEDSSPSNGIFIKGLPKSTSERSLIKTFSRFGDVDKVEIITYNNRKEPVGLSYVWFTSEEAAELAKTEMDGKFFNGRFIVVEIARPKSPTSRVSATPYKF